MSTKNPDVLKCVADYRINLIEPAAMSEEDLDNLMNGEKEDGNLSSNEFPPEIRAAARGMMDLSPEKQKIAIEIINYLSQKGKEAKKE